LQGGGEPLAHVTVVVLPCGTTTVVSRAGRELPMLTQAASAIGASNMRRRETLMGVFLPG